MTESGEKTRTLKHESFFHHHLIDEITLLVLISCSYIGVAYTDISPLRSQHYWYLMVPLFFIASLVTEWKHVSMGKYPWKSVIWNHSLQWLAVLAAVKMVFIIQEIGRLNNETTGLILLLLFALTTFITGIRLGWLFRLAGIFLAISLMLLAYLERYLWVLIIIGVAILVLHHLIMRHRKKKILLEQSQNNFS
jgi:hypothetical protein